MNAEQLHLHQFLALPETGQALRPYRLWVPGDQVVGHKVQLPAAARRKWPEMVPWLLEDQLLSSPDSLHFSLGRPDADNRVGVLSVPRDQMDQWQALCDSGAGRVVAILPDYLALPWEEGGLSLMVDGDHWAVRCGAEEGYAGDREFVAGLLSRQLVDRPGASVSYIGPADRVPEFCQDRSRHLSDSLDWSFCDFPQEFNLLRADYRPVRSSAMLKSWWPAMTAASLLFVLGMGNWVADFYRISREIPQLQASLATTYRSLFGGNLPTANVRAAIETEIEFRENQYLATQNMPLSLLIQLDAVLSNCSGCEIKSIKGDEDRVELQISASDSVETRLRAISDANIQITRTGENDLQVIAMPQGVNRG